jgi:hypothetical protein
VFKHGDAMFEERITVWRAKDEDHAIQLAEEDAAHYNEEITDSTNPTTYVGLAQCFELYDEPGTPGAEVFSLIRDRALAPDDYLNRYFDTGDEHERKS